jgi:hypothetical protein
MVRPWGFPTPLSGGRSRVLCRCRRGLRDTPRSSPRGVRPTDRIASLQEALDCPGELAAVGIEDREVDQCRVPLRWGCAPLAVPGVQAYMVMVVSCDKKRCSWQAEVCPVGGQLEAKHVAVEAHRSIEVSDAQMHVSDAHRRVKLRTTRLLWCARHGVPFCRVRRLQGQGKGSEG